MFTFGLGSYGSGGGVVVACSFDASIADDILSADCCAVLSANITEDALSADIDETLTATINVDTNEAEICPVN